MNTYLGLVPIISTAPELRREPLFDTVSISASQTFILPFRLKMDAGRVIEDHVNIHRQQIGHAPVERLLDLDFMLRKKAYRPAQMMEQMMEADRAPSGTDPSSFIHRSYHPIFDRGARHRFAAVANTARSGGVLRSSRYAAATKILRIPRRS